MPEVRVRVVLTGAREGVAPDTVAARLATLLGSSRREMRDAVAGAPVELRGGLDEDEARRLQDTLRAAGATCRVEPEPEPAEPPAPAGTFAPRPKVPPAPAERAVVPAVSGSSSASPRAAGRRGAGVPRLGIVGVAVAVVVAAALLLVLVESRREAPRAAVLEVGNELLAVLERVAGEVESSRVYGQLARVEQGMAEAGDGDALLGAMQGTAAWLEGWGGGGEAELAELEQQLRASEVELDALERLGASRRELETLRFRSRRAREARDAVAVLADVVERYVSFAARPVQAGDAGAYVLGYGMLRAVAAAAFADAVERIRAMPARGDRGRWRAAVERAEEGLERCAGWRTSGP